MNLPPEMPNKSKTDMRDLLPIVVGLLDVGLVSFAFLMVNNKPTTEFVFANRIFAIILFLVFIMVGLLMIPFSYGGQKRLTDLRSKLLVSGSIFLMAFSGTVLSLVLWWLPEKMR